MANKLRSPIRPLIAYIYRLKLSYKVTLLYSVLLLVTLTGSGLFVYTRFNRTTDQIVRQASIQSLTLIENNVLSLFENINHYSKMILANDTIRDALKNERSYQDVITVRRMDLLLHAYMESMPQVSSIYIYDFQGHRYGVDSLLDKRDRITRITDASWFAELKNLSGAYLLANQSGGLFAEDTSGSFVSHLRIINDLDSLTPIGVLVINITSESIAQSFGNGLDRNNIDVAIVDNSQQPIVAFKAFDFASLGTRILEQKADPVTEVFYQDGQRYLLASHSFGKFGWTVISAIRFDAYTVNLRALGSIAMTALAATLLILFLGTLAITRLVTVPVIRLEKSMRQIEQGYFAPMQQPDRTDEIGRLIRGYNTMVQEIQRLIAKTIHDQSEIRQAELQALQAQIKPHFLYNTFDTISSLALDGDIERVYTLVKSLGSYYRLSLSKGKEVITLHEEMEIVQNYLMIQQIRYPDLFEATCSIDPEIKDVPILKLVLQPLVENALYHGIKPLGSEGLIQVMARQDDTGMTLVVEDNGVGMDEAILNDLVTKPSKPRSFGLASTLERIRLFYGLEHFFDIISRPGQGTRIQIHIPLQGGSQNG